MLQTRQRRTFLGLLILIITKTAGIRLSHSAALTREVLDPRISLNLIPPEEMRSIPYDSEELNQVWQSVYENLNGSVSSFPNGFNKFNEVSFRVLEKITDPVTSALEWAIGAFISKLEYEPVCGVQHFDIMIKLLMTQSLQPVFSSIMVGTAAIVVVVYFLIDCLKKAGTAIPSYAKIATNDLEKFPKDSSSSRVISVVAPAISPGHNREVPDEFGTLEIFLKPTRFSSDQLATYTRNYATVLGSGSYGVVFKGELPDGTLVAVKVLTNIDNKRMAELFIEEVNSIGKIHHIDLVRLFGFCFDSTTRALIYEYMENGSLHRFLFGDKAAIDWRKMHEIAAGTAKGITYLHEQCEQRIVHYDIKPSNILLDQNMNPKVADFGLAKLYSREMSWIPMSGFRGTHGHAAPEMSKPYPVTYKCDVYSFGMILFDIVGRRIKHNGNPSEPMPGLPQCTWHMLLNGKLLEMVCGFPESEREAAVRMLKVALLCIQHKPVARPAMSIAVKRLETRICIST